MTLSVYKSALILLCCLGLSACSESETSIPASPAQPNILFILADDHRWDLIGKYHPIVKTPNIDQLANQGTVFKNTFVTTPICASSRISILTGLTERTHDFTFQQPDTGAQESANMYPALLKKHGYRSGFVGKYEIKISGDDNDRFDYFKPILHERFEQYEGKQIPQTYYIAELAKKFIKQPENTQKPWVLAVNFWDPHALDKDTENQFHYPEEFESYYEDVTIPAAKLSSNSDFEQLPEFLKTSAARERWQYRFSNDELYQKMTKRHYRSISGLDKAVGMIIEQLKASGMAENTIIVYTGDNGFAINERQLAGKWFGWEEDLRVPLIIFDPRNKRSSTKEVTQIALNIDLAPTFLSMAGVAIPTSYQGRSLLPLLGNEPVNEWREDFLFEHMYQPKHTFIPPMVGVREVDYKYVDFYKHGYEQLYDLRNDPEEITNLAASSEHAAILKRMREKTARYINEYEQQRSEEVKQRGSFLNQRTAK